MPMPSIADILDDNICPADDGITFGPNDEVSFSGILETISQHDPETWDKAEQMFDDYLEIHKRDLHINGEDGELIEEMEDEYYSAWNDLRNGNDPEYQ